ncbi:unnamed protein product [Toxocara canis]|uniref:Transposase n=1 Tax=Toxocara canis TaxID=6265 RepID=A0A183US58_TOXCA|nr:unnamed protein product [Toxocara canis]
MALRLRRVGLEPTPPETGAQNQRLRPLGHLAEKLVGTRNFKSIGAAFDESGIRTHASEETAALNQRLRPHGHLAESIAYKEAKNR